MAIGDQRIEEPFRWRSRMKAFYTAFDRRLSPFAVFIFGENYFLERRDSEESLFGCIHTQSIRHQFLRLYRYLDPFLSYLDIISHTISSLNQLYSIYVAALLSKAKAAPLP